MIIDIQYTVNLVMNKGLVKDIHHACRRFVRVQFNEGTRIIRMEDTLTRFGTIWFDYRFIANILSLSKANNKYR